MAKKSSPTICIIAGETSGDFLGGQLANAIRKQNTHCQLVGVGSTQMKNAGVDILIDSQTLAVTGIFEILAKLPTLRRSMKKLIHLFKSTPPDLLILIDYPGFNLRLAKKAKALGIKVMYYVSPQIWAWRYNRIKLIKNSIDKMAVLFPFEKKLYEKEGVPVEFVGHPLSAATQPSLDREQALQLFQLNPQHTTIGLLPGSRTHELERLLPTMLNTVKLLKKHLPHAQFILPLAPHLSQKILSKYDLSGITLVHNNMHNAVQLCDAAIVASGTVTLEVGLLKIPMVIIYKVNALTALIAHCIGEIRKMTRGEKWFGLCNIVAEEKLMPELLQSAATPTAICHEVLTLIQDQPKRNYIQQQLAELHHKLGHVNAAEKAAHVALELLE